VSEHEQTRGHERLNGWKEIANQLGISVRTAQRWEATLGLPVHRIHTPSKEIVYVFERQIEEWLDRADQHLQNGSGHPETRTGLPPAPAHLSSAGRAQPSPKETKHEPRSRWVRVWFLAALFFVGMLVGWWVSHMAQRQPLRFHATSPHAPAGMHWLRPAVHSHAEGAVAVGKDVFRT
jgi:hypothetical protein